MSLFKSSFMRTIYEEYIKGMKSGITMPIVAIILIGLGLYLTPKHLELFHLSVKEADNLVENLLSLSVGVFSAVVAITAIVLAIIQMMNRKLSITELTFRNTFFIPFTYWGLLCIVILTIFLPNIEFDQNTKDNWHFTYARIAVIMTYFFIIQLGLAILVFTRTFVYLDSNRLIDKYLQEISRETINESHSRKRSGEKLSRFSHEVQREIDSVVNSGDFILLGKLLKTYENTYAINPTSNYLNHLKFHLPKWHISAITTRDSIIRGESLSLLISTWRNLLEVARNTQSEEAKYQFNGIPAAVLKDLYSAKADGEVIGKLSFNYALNLKEISLYPILLETSISLRNKKLLLAEVQLQDLMLLIERIVENNDEATLEKVLNQLMQLHNRLNIEENFSFDISENTVPELSGASPNESKDANVVTFQRKIIYNRLIVASKYIYKRIHNDDLTKFNARIFEQLIPKNLLFVSETGDSFLQCAQYENCGWRDWIWNLEDRLDGVMYYLPNEETIITYGFITILICDDKFRPNISGLSDFHAIHSQAKQILEKIKLNPKTYNLLFNNPDQINDTITELENYFVQQHANNREAKAILLGEQPIDSEKVDIFKRTIHDQWKNSRSIYDILNYFPDSLVKNPERQLLQVGTARMNLQEGKMMFTKAPYYENVYNINWGYNVNDQVEKLLIERAFSLKSNLITKKDIISCAEHISQLPGDLYIAFIGSKSYLKWSNQLNNTGNYQLSNSSASSYPFKYEGIYKNKVIFIHLKNPSLKETIIVFKPGSIKYLQRLNESWMDLQLEVSIKENTAEEITEIIAKNENLKSADPETAKKVLAANCQVSIQEVMDFEVVAPTDVYLYNIGSSK